MLSENMLAFREDRKGVPESTRGASNFTAQCGAGPALLLASGTESSWRLTGLQRFRRAL